MASIGDPFKLAFDKLEYDHAEDDDDVLGNWIFDRDGDLITVIYMPYENGESPYRGAKATYRITQLTYEEDVLTND